MRRLSDHEQAQLIAIGRLMAFELKRVKADNHTANAWDGMLSDLNDSKADTKPSESRYGMSYMPISEAL